MTSAELRGQTAEIDTSAGQVRKGITIHGVPRVNQRQIYWRIGFGRVPVEKGIIFALCLCISVSVSIATVLE
jgi:hypothetical protein